MQVQSQSGFVWRDRIAFFGFGAFCIFLRLSPNLTYGIVDRSMCLHLWYPCWGKVTQISFVIDNN